MPDPTNPDDELMRTARAYMARLSSQPPPRNLAEDAVKAAFSRRRRFSLAGLIGGSAVIIAGAAAAVVALAFHTPPFAGIPAHTPPAVSTASPSATPATAPTQAAPTPTPTATPFVNVCQANPAPATAAQVVISRPAAHAVVTSPLTVSGRINAFEAMFQIAVKDAAGRNLATKTGHSQQGQTLSPFSEGVPFAVGAQTPACVWVFQLSAKDGSAQTIAQVPITLMP
jgi:Immunoglobulin-like domain of bacterial spore germination